MLLLLYNPKLLSSIYYKTIYHFKTISSIFFKNFIFLRIEYIIFSSYQIHEIPPNSPDRSQEFSECRWWWSTSTTPIILSKKERKKKKSTFHAVIFNQGFTTESWGELLLLPSKQNTELNPHIWSSKWKPQHMHWKIPLSYSDSPLIRSH